MTCYMYVREDPADDLAAALQLMTDDDLSRFFQMSVCDDIAYEQQAVLSEMKFRAALGICISKDANGLHISQEGKECYRRGPK